MNIYITEVPNPCIKYFRTETQSLSNDFMDRCRSIDGVLDIKQSDKKVRIEIINHLDWKRIELEFQSIAEKFYKVEIEEVIRERISEFELQKQAEQIYSQLIRDIDETNKMTVS